MKKATYAIDFTSQYKNNGQAKEQWLRYVLTGEIVKADNKPYYMGGDIGSIQVKSAKATACKGYDIQAYVNQDGATSYAYITKNYVVYHMSPAEWVKFVEMFSYRTYESAKNNGTPKMRLYDESKKMLNYLEEHSRQVAPPGRTLQHAKVLKCKLAWSARKSKLTSHRLQARKLVKVNKNKLASLVKMTVDKPKRKEYNIVTETKERKRK